MHACTCLYHELQHTVNPEYFVCILFSYISYAAAFVWKIHAYEKFKASQRISSGQRLYKNFMHTNGRRSPAYENLVHTKYSGFTVVMSGPRKKCGGYYFGLIKPCANFLNMLCLEAILSWTSMNPSVQYALSLSRSWLVSSPCTVMVNEGGHRCLWDLGVCSHSNWSWKCMMMSRKKIRCL